MLDMCIQNMHNPLEEITVDMGKDQPLWFYVMKAISGLQVINLLRLYPIEGAENAPFIEICNWKWNPHPSPDQIQTRRRETGVKLKTKTVGDNRIGVLEFDVYIEARDKNKNLEREVVHNVLHIPIEDDKGRYFLDNLRYSEYQLVDKLLYPNGEDSFIIKSLLPVVIRYEESTVQSIKGMLVTSKVGMVKIFTTMEPILSCFMHIPSPLSYLEVFPILQFCDRVLDNDDQYEYFKPLEDVDDVYIKAYKKGLEKFDYVRNILVMAMKLIERHHPNNYAQLCDPKWWIYDLSYYEPNVEHRGACHQMYVARMLDTISAEVLPIPEIDKRVMVSLLKYVLQTEFDDMNFFSFENKRLRKNEVISTIITALVSDKLKKMFKFGCMIKMTDIQPLVKFSPDCIRRKMYDLGTVHPIDFANDLDYYHFYRYTKKGPNSLGRMDRHKITFINKQMNPSMIGKQDLVESTKDVGQSGIISPWGDISALTSINVNKYPNIKYDLYKFIEEEFPQRALRFNANNIEEYNAILDKIACSVYIDVDYHIPEGGFKAKHDEETTDTD